MKFPAGQLVALGNLHALFHTIQSINGHRSQARLIADNADNLLLAALHHLGLQACALNNRNDFFNVFRRSIHIHDNNHNSIPFYINA